MTVRPAHLMAVGVLVASGLVLGPGLPRAGAEDLPTPRMDELRLDGTTAYITFTDYTDGENGYLIRLVERDNRSNIIFDWAEVPAVPDKGRQATRQLSPIPSGVALCAEVRSSRFNIDAPLGPIAPQVENATSYPSNSVCADPANAPVDLAVDNIRGNIDPQASASPAYLVVFRNAGGADATDVVVDISTSVVVDISTSGVATFGDHGAVQAGWAATGFSCAPQPPSGGQTAALRCTGGKLKAGEQTNPAVIVKFTGPGLGTVHASIGRVGGAYANPGNDTSALNLNVS